MIKTYGNDSRLSMPFDVNITGKEKVTEEQKQKAEKAAERFRKMMKQWEEENNIRKNSK